MTGCMSCCKILCCCFIVFTNILTIVTSVVMILLGIILSFGFSMLSGVLKEPINSAASTISDLFRQQLGITIDIFDLLTQINIYTGTMGIVFLILGVILFAVSIVGCCGACCTVKACLIIYAVFVVLAFICQACIIIVWFADSDLLKGQARAAMETSVRNYNGFNSTNIYSLFQNMVQIFVGCCGVDNGTDFYTMAPNWNREYTTTISGFSVSFNLTYPVTCCKFNATSFKPLDEFCPYNNTTPDTSNYQKGCYTEIFNFIDKYFQLNILFYTLGGILGYQALLFAGAVIIIVADRKNHSKVKPK